MGSGVWENTTNEKFFLALKVGAELEIQHSASRTKGCQKAHSSLCLQPSNNHSASPRKNQGPKRGLFRPPRMPYGTGPSNNSALFVGLLRVSEDTFCEADESANHNKEIPMAGRTAAKNKSASTTHKVVMAKTQLPAQPSVETSMCLVSWKRGFHVFLPHKLSMSSVFLVTPRFP